MAAGNPATAAAAEWVLRHGGNAVDAAVGAGFAAAVAEPGLTSLGGGGFLLLRNPDDTEHLLDFFVDAPGLGLPVDRLQPRLIPVTVRFSGADQIFHAGAGSVAVPGVLSGYLAATSRFGRLPLSDIVEPARRLATFGARLSASQAEVLALLHDILTLTPEARQVFTPAGRLPITGELVRNHQYAQFLSELATSPGSGWAVGSHAAALIESMTSYEGLLTATDIASYHVHERTPLKVGYRGSTLTTNSAPSFGGAILASALEALAELPLAGPVPSVVRSVEALVAATDANRTMERPSSSRGTTHISVVDADGAMASLTTSNGSCSGVMVPGTGVQLNNMMGESDLHPNGFHATEPGIRVGSMMAPSLLDVSDGRVVCLGSGGSERIRSALLQTILRMVDDRRDVHDAVSEPRIHFDGKTVQAEPPLRSHLAAALSTLGPVNQWSAKNLYFGGVNAVVRFPDGSVAAVGDSRRDGNARVVAVAAR